MKNPWEPKVIENGTSGQRKCCESFKKMLLPKNVALSILSKYNVTQIDLDGKLLDEDLCFIIDTEFRFRERRWLCSIGRKKRICKENVSYEGQM